MIIEKEVELLILQNVLNNIKLNKQTFKFDDGEYICKKVIDRYKELTKEFLEPYALIKS